MNELFRSNTKRSSAANSRKNSRPSSKDRKKQSIKDAEGVNEIISAEEPIINSGSSPGV